MQRDPWNFFDEAPSFSGELSTGAIVGIVFAILFLLCCVLPLCWVIGKKWWIKRHRWPTRRRFELYRDPTDVRHTSLTNTISHESEVTVENSFARHTFGGFNNIHTSQRHCISSSYVPSTDEPKVTHESGNECRLAQAPPPTYKSAENFPSANTPPQDLPPPYPGLRVDLPSTLNHMVTPYPTAL